MKNKISIIVSHYYPDTKDFKNPLLETLKSIVKENSDPQNFEVIIADDGSHYSKSIIDNYSKKIKIKNDSRSIYLAENESLNQFLKKNFIQYDFIKKWVYLPKLKSCMSKSRVLNYAVKKSSFDNLLFLDDDNYFISGNSIEDTMKLFNDYNFIVGQIKDNNGRLRKFTSNRVQGTTIAINKKILLDVGGFGEWTEEFSCGIDSDLWIRLFDYYKHNQFNACYTNKLSTYDSHSKRWGKYTSLFKDFRLKKKFYEMYNCKNYKSSKHNESRNKILWIKNLI